MNINVHGIELDQDKEFNSLEEILETIERKNHVLIKMLADKEDITNYSSEEVENLGEIKSLDIYTKSVRELIIEGIKDGEEYLPGLISGLEVVIQKYSTGNEDEGNELLGQALEGFQWLNSLIANLSVFELEINTRELSLTELNAKWQDNINELYQAMKVKDSVLLSDILEYEITPLLNNYLTYLREINDSIH